MHFHRHYLSNDYRLFRYIPSFRRHMFLCRKKYGNFPICFGCCRVFLSIVIYFQVERSIIKGAFSPIGILQLLCISAQETDALHC
jgi:hypothetical protein